MHITLNITAPSNNDNDLLSLEIALDTTIGILKESVYAETSFPPSTQHLYHNGQLLNDDTKTMEQLSIGDGEMLALHVRDNTRVPAAPSRPARQQTASSRAQPDPETIRLQLLGNPTLRQQFIDQRPELAGVIDDPRRFAEAIENLGRQEQEAQRRRQEEIERLNDDPFDMDAQLKIAEMIREERVQENLQNAIEHTPEGQQPPFSISALHANHTKCLVEFTCCTSMSWLTTSKSKLSSTRELKPPSCRQAVQRPVISCV
ncbi:hypothetical protein BJ878DRAFT_278052 [Calycina marina]|uniref:Ubiquitin-like domain-containing protein n=1 Tax=Calycina marina TaxID=1763456 RepID=A0A9P8CGR8_9HELO|nr:hypothetical protein BJ878DRAFT_278052 [Calycina marina]